MQHKNAADRPSLFWADQVAAEVVEKWQAKEYVTEMGLGASGIPHVGSAGDGVRSYVVSLAIRELGKKSRFIAYSDDRDGLRKVPSGFPASLEREIGKPVSLIPDPFGCHASFALHISSLLMDAFDRIGVRFELHRGHEEYERGGLDKEIIEILTRAKEAGEIIKRTTGSEKYLDRLPFLPICATCGRVYTTRAHTFLPKEKKVLYSCDQEFVGKSGGREIRITGCGAQGEAGIRDGKLAWKVEFAARWHALNVHYEAYGKDILDSVRCNDAVSQELLGRAPPVHSFYELFTERGGEKISKSKGNVFTPQKWLSYASPESLRLLFLKRLGTTRIVDVEAIPAYMDEVDSLADVAFGKTRIGNDKELAHRKRLFAYVHFLSPPAKPGLTVPYGKLVNIVRATAGNQLLLRDVLAQAGLAADRTQQEELERRIGYATQWAAIDKTPPATMALSTREKRALSRLAHVLRTEHSPEELQNAVFTIAKDEGMQPREFFTLLYRILLGVDRGPKAGHLIAALGQDAAREAIMKRL
ncbi:MAG: lysine--tRNA ligase [Candidatus Aenigmarchaeota archaeon]|nr:lysine--tRNA ligase [Candidatus Aenigmarchaeota archaeon]